MARKTVSVTRRVSVRAPVAEVWRLIGDFHGLVDWHPAVARSDRAAIGDEEFRKLTTVDGAEILEHLVGKTTHSYTYTIIRSPLPVVHYESRLEANTAGSGTEVTWSSSFTPTADNAEAVIGGIYDAGLKNLSGKFG